MAAAEHSNLRRSFSYMDRNQNYEMRANPQPAGSGRRAGAFPWRIARSGEGRAPKVEIFSVRVNAAFQSAAAADNEAKGRICA